MKPKPVNDEPMANWLKTLKPQTAYNLIFKIMLSCGWGVGEFPKFNKAETWKTIEATLVSGNAEYFRFGFRGRKSNRRSFYSLIPAKLLTDAIAREVKGKIKLPFSHKNRKGMDMPLDETSLIMNRQYLESAFETALKRGPIILTQGHPTPHESSLGVVKCRSFVRTVRSSQPGIYQKSLLIELRNS